MAMTTIKIDSDLRDRLNGAAREQGVTAGSFVELLFERWLRDQRFAAMREAMARTPEDLAESYRRETVPWDAVAANGLADEPPYGSDPA